MAGREELWADLGLVEDAEETHHGQFFLQQADLVPAEAEVRVVVLGHVDLEQGLKLFGVFGQLGDHLFVQKLLQVVIHLHPILLLLRHDQLQI